MSEHTLAVGDKVRLVRGYGRGDGEQATGVVTSIDAGVSVTWTLHDGNCGHSWYSNHDAATRLALMSEQCRYEHWGMRCVLPRDHPETPALDATAATVHCAGFNVRKATPEACGSCSRPIEDHIGDEITEIRPEPGEPDGQQVPPDA